MYTFTRVYTLAHFCHHRMFCLSSPRLNPILCRSICSKKKRNVWLTDCWSREEKKIEIFQTDERTKEKNRKDSSHLCDSYLAMWKEKFADSLFAFYASRCQLMINVLLFQKSSIARSSPASINEMIFVWNSSFTHAVSFHPNNQAKQLVKQKNSDSNEEYEHIYFVLWWKPCWCSILM